MITMKTQCLRKQSKYSVFLLFWKIHTKGIKWNIVSPKSVPTASAVNRVRIYWKETLYKIGKANKPASDNADTRNTAKNP